MYRKDLTAKKARAASDPGPSETPLNADFIEQQGHYYRDRYYFH